MAKISVKEPVITLTAGPVQAYPRITRAMSRPVHYDYDAYFQAVYEEVARKAATALRVEAPALILHAEPAVGLEAAAASLISPDDVVLNLASGVYGKGFGYWAARYAKEVVEIEVPYNEDIKPEQVRDKLRERSDIAIVTAVHHDTPSGTLNPVEEIGRIVRDHGALFLVDAVSSFAGMNIHPDDCCADVFVTGPGKCMGGAPGLTLVAVSESAWAHMEGNPSCPSASILSLTDWKNAWSKEAPFPFTPAIAEVNGLDAALDAYLEEGPEAVWARHDLTARACRAGVRALGLELWPAREEIAAPTTTAIRVPDGLTDEEIVAAMRDGFGTIISYGRAETKGKLLRIGHMGPVAEPVYALVAVTTLGGTLRRLGREVDVGAAVDAATAVILAARD